MTKKIPALEKFIADFPTSFSATLAQLNLLDAIIKQTPDNSDKIYAQALRTTTNAPDYQKYYIYQQVADRLLEAGMNDKAEEFAKKGLVLTEQELAELSFSRRSNYWITLGKINLKKGNLIKSELLFRRAISGKYEGNAALLGLAEIAGKHKMAKQQYNYLVLADAKGSLKREQRAALEAFYRRNHRNSLDGLREMLDANYKRLNPSPFSVAKYTPTANRTKRTVLAELFTGAACPPCVAADVAFDTEIERYNRDELVILVYHLHIPAPDPLTNAATEQRAKFYAANSTPTFFVNGERDNGGGARRDAKRVYDRVNPKIETLLTQPNATDLSLSATMENGVVKAEANAENIKDDVSNLRLHIVLVENEVSYTGENGVRFHPMVVREIGGENHEGFVLKDKKSQFEWQFKVPEISRNLKTYLDKYEQERQKINEKFSFAEKKFEINPKKLAVVAFVQNEKTKNILQAKFVDLSEPEKIAQNK